MKYYEYIRLGFDFGDLKRINDFSNKGWRVVAVVQVDLEIEPYYALMERERGAPEGKDRT